MGLYSSTSHSAFLLLFHVAFVGVSGLPPLDDATGFVQLGVEVGVQETRARHSRGGTQEAVDEGLEAAFWSDLWRGGDVLDALVDVYGRGNYLVDRATRGKIRVDDENSKGSQPFLSLLDVKGGGPHLIDEIRTATRTGHTPNAAEMAAINSEFQQLLSDVSDGPRVQLMGMKATGTNLVMSLVKYNFQARVLDGMDLGVGLFWKHAPLDQILTGRSDNVDNFKKVAGLAIIRNPLAMFTHVINSNSWKNMCKVKWMVINKAHLMEHCGPAKTIVPVWDGGATVTVEAANIIALWNEYTRKYLEDLPSIGFHRTHVIRYEDLLMNPEAAVAEIAALLDLYSPKERGEQLRFPETPQHLSSAKSSRKEAIDEYRSKRYLEDFEDWDNTTLRFACEQLDRDLMRRLQYDDCDAFYD